MADRPSPSATAGAAGVGRAGALAESAGPGPGLPPPAGARGLAVVALSGGLDSTTLLARYADRGYRLLAVSVDYGQRHARELHAARAVAVYFAAEHLVVDLRAVGQLLSGSALTDPAVEVPSGHYEWDSMRATVVPNRNAIIANVLVGIGVARRAELVALGMHAGDHAVYPDCRPAFLTALQQLVAVANDGYDPPRVEAPFISTTKADIVRLGARLGAPLQLTWSCYRGGNRHCGICGTCYERREAFTLADVPDPTTYEDAHTSFDAAADHTDTNTGTDIDTDTVMSECSADQTRRPR